MDGLREILKGSAAASLAAGLVTSITLIPFLVVPLTVFFTRRKRSINHHLENKKKPDDYFFVITRTIVMSGAATGLFMHCAANSDNILWSLDDASPTTLIKTFTGCHLLREFFGYWAHRSFHSKLLYERFHAAHHNILHCHDEYDGYYIDSFETACAAFFAYLPAFIIPNVHVTAVIIYQVFAAFFVFSMNHSGREFRIAFNVIGFAKPVVLYNAQHHDDHHKYRHGNYSELMPILDVIFGTDLVIKRRRTLPARRLWRKAQKAKTVIKVAGAFRCTNNQSNIQKGTVA